MANNKCVCLQCISGFGFLILLHFLSKYITCVQTGEAVVLICLYLSICMYFLKLQCIWALRATVDMGWKAAWMHDEEMLLKNVH